MVAVLRKCFLLVGLMFGLSRQQDRVICLHCIYCIMCCHLCVAVAIILRHMVEVSLVHNAFICLVSSMTVRFVPLFFSTCIA